ncbi:MAG: class I SAM-dependent methyltransferase [Deltaproteobacteria bacterium]|nr:class I SAM-dependent methyltransferase [Deltaproteobacteria bacterium]
MSSEPVDLAQQSHWDGLYADAKAAPAYRPDWTPRHYDDRTIEDMLLTSIRRQRAASVLEVGCGNSVWLPHLARAAGVAVAGLDYSPLGCDLARRNLALGGVSGPIFCGNVFEAEPHDVGRHDLVFSLGLVEHFADLDGVLRALLRFVKPGGMLLTEIPNMPSIHGLLSWVWQPDILRKHQRIDRRQLVEAHRRIGLLDVEGRYLGAASISVVGWEIESRWKLGSKTVPWLVRRADRVVQRAVLRRVRRFGGVAPFAPFISATGIAPVDATPA